MLKKTTPDRRPKRPGPIVTAWHKLRRSLQNRIYRRPYALTASRAHLPRGKFVEMPDRMLFCLFDELVNFVEIDLAVMGGSRPEDAKRFRQPKRARIKPWRSRAAGLAFLGYEGDPIACERHQAKWQVEVLTLFIWWVEERPARTNPAIRSGYQDYLEDKSRRDLGLFDDDPLAGKWKAAERLGEMIRISDEYTAEDDEMLERLIKVRHHLRT